MKNILSIQSHVVFGHAGNSAAEFPIRRVGVNVWPLNTVQFSNHTQYGQWTGCVMPAEHLTEIAQGIGNIGHLKECDAVLSGYIGSPEQGGHILEIVRRVKEANPNAIYFCDPVMGTPEKGCIVPAGVSDFHCQQSLQASDIIAPNLPELELLSARTIHTVEEAVSASRALCERGPRLVLVKHLSRAAMDQGSFEMLLVTRDEAWHIRRPLVDFGPRQPVGVGDLTSGLLLANLLKGATPVQALEHTTAAVYEVMCMTKQLGQYELQLVAAQDGIANPGQHFAATSL
ncbi:pyridoxal kinase PdxY [Dickeya lacustris]|uniref:Pyridoxal kinase PdxY n=1 Tax=Dickeya lacustris TaxID=2259638 RepID=A0ABY8G939_9GAMM|nr:pyridoxal kinase PdxY [Dickeya lacustris]WFN56443.1 pyridoxal kinase PdxY [Dickeya lacustris]